MIEETDDRRQRNTAQARLVTIETEVRVRVLDDEGFLVSEVIVAEPGGFAVVPYLHLNEQLNSVTPYLAERAGAALDRIAQETVWGR